MHKLSRDFVSRWADSDDGRYPATVDTICPHCGLPVIFMLADWAYVPPVETMLTKSRCVACREEASFFWITDQKAPRSGGAKQMELFIHPTPVLLRRPVEGISHNGDFNGALQRAYASAINMYNAREWTGSVVVSRRTLEEITKSLLPPEAMKLSLAKQVEALGKKKDLAAPLRMLADSLGRTGNLDAYFKLQQEPDQEIATQVLELLDALVEYLFALPRRIEELHDRIGHSAISVEHVMSGDGESVELA